ncbi:HK97 family phage prohead protease [Paenibacillus anseongense]|uniref:HK97 family phage prohead protease n=1 Tax=Paenibacillus anseongense TaxID=2682845 RepID=UPI002DB6C74B|nr:HK97 family phage prohead protease [Paenibacillus anseongense]MEC0266703.1 HK97 family phage prohead protease [Paenibacillus anseongense]
MSKNALDTRNGGRLTAKNERHRISELRAYTKVSTRSGNNIDELWIEGYAAVFNSPTVLYTRSGVDHKEIIDSRAFDGADMSDVVLNQNHEGEALASTANKTLELKVDNKGLFVRARLESTPDNRNLYMRIRDGFISGMSFMFAVEKDSNDHSTHTRTIHKFKKIYDVTITSKPAYKDTSIGVPVTPEERRQLFLKKVDELIKQFEEM